MSTDDASSDSAPSESGVTRRDVPMDWEALEDAFENNAPEVHSYLHVPTGDVLRIVDGVADPQMHARIASDISYLRIDPVSSREQYRWMERYIPMVEDPQLQLHLTEAIDGKGAFRRFKDVLMSHAPERESWFAFRSERLRIFMEAWLNAHAPARRSRGAESVRRHLREIIENLSPRDLQNFSAFGDFLVQRSPEESGSDEGCFSPSPPSSRPASSSRPPSVAPESDDQRDSGEASPSTRPAAVGGD
jgi:hypothetical protein